MEHYGGRAPTSKGTMFSSMGVGDPFIANHARPHTESIDSWKQVLDKKEIELYCRMLGARIFHELGYSEPLAQAEAWTGVQFEMEPDAEWLELRTKQLQELTGCKWEDDYQMQTASSDAHMFFKKNDIQSDHSDIAAHPQASNPEMVQLQIALRSYEKRLEMSYNEQRRLREQLQHTRNKIDQIKSKIPFSRILSSWANAYLLQDGRKK